MVVMSLAEGIAAVTAEVDASAARAARLDDVKDDLDALLGVGARWSARETARIHAWEEREVTRVRAVSAKCVALVAEVARWHTAVGSGVMTQRLALRASLDEIAQELLDLPCDEAARFAKLRLFSAEREQLVGKLAKGVVRLPTVAAVSAWRALPDLSEEFGAGDSDDGKGPERITREVEAAALSKLVEVQESRVRAVVRGVARRNRPTPVSLPIPHWFPPK